MRPSLQTLETPRLRLEPLDVDHAEALFEVLRDERLYAHIAERPPARVEDLRERYRFLASRQSPDGRETWLNWALRREPESDYVGYVQATLRADGVAHVAYVLSPSSWGQGLAREAVAALLEHLRMEWSVPLVRASVDPRNLRSIALLERLGFTLVGIHKDAEEIHGVPADEAEYELVLG